MRDLAAAATRLRKVKRAHDEFLMRWALDCLIAQQHVIERVNEDVHHAADFPGKKNADGLDSLQPGLRDWSMLYRGSVLDD